MEKKITVKRKPRKCPACGSKKIASIMYGMPFFSPELEKDLEDGRIVLGGCSIMDDDPKWECSECEAPFYYDSDFAQERRGNRL